VDTLVQGFQTGAAKAAKAGRALLSQAASCMLPVDPEVNMETLGEIECIELIPQSSQNLFLRRRP